MDIAKHLERLTVSDGKGFDLASMPCSLDIDKEERPALEEILAVNKARIAELQDTYPLMRFSLFSGNAADVGERLENGRLDFGVFIGHTDLAKFETLPLPAQDRWGAFMRGDDPLAAQAAVSPDDLADRPLIFSRQAGREMQAWFKRDLEDLDVVATYNLLYNAALLARRGVGYVVSLEGIVDTSAESDLAFRPLSPPLAADVCIAWKRYQSFSPAAQVFLEKIRDLWG